MLWISLALAATPTCFWSRETPKNPRSLEVPLNGQSGDYLTVDWILKGTWENAGDPAAFVTIRFQDGQEFMVRPTVGQHASIHPTSSREAQVLPDTYDTPATRQTIALGRSAPIEKVTINAKLQNQTLCVGQVQVLQEESPTDYATNTTGWYPFAMAHTVQNLPAGLPVTGPAGAKGFVRIDENGNFVWPDGTRARFWGTNLVGEAAIPEKAEAEAYAETLASLGFNIVRIHHIDRPGRGILDADRGKPGHEDPFDDARLDRLDYFISKLEARGIHIWAEVATAREFTTADHVSDPTGAPNGHKVYPMWEPDWEAAYMLWFEQFWARTNPYTNKKYTDDPAIVVLELSNEHTLINLWGAGMEQLAPSHLKTLQASWNIYLKEKYGTDEKLFQAWAGSTYAGLQNGESLTTGSIAREPAIPALADLWPDQRRRDLLDFYWKLERSFFDRLYAKARSLGFKVPMIPTIQYNRPLLQAMHSDAELTDIHVAYDKGGDGLVSGESVLQNPSYALNLTTVSTLGRAAAISELNHAHPNPYRAEAPWLWTTLASLQSIDVLIWSSWAEFSYSEDVSNSAHKNDLRTNPLLLTQLPAASAAFRGGWIPEASGLFPVNLQESTVRSWQGQYEPPKPLEIFSIYTLLSDQIRTVLNGYQAPRKGPLTPGVGWWNKPGVIVLDQPKVQARIGFPGLPTEGVGAQNPSRLSVSLDQFAAVAMTSADDKPLDQSSRAWLTISARAENTGQTWASFGTVLRAPGTGPILLEPVTGQIRFAWPRTPIIETLGQDGQVSGTLPVTGKKGWWTLEASAIRTPWLQIR